MLSLQFKGALNGAAKWMVGKSREFFSWLIRPLVGWLKPHSQNIFARNVPNAISVGRLIVSVWVDWQIYYAATTPGRWFWISLILLLMLSDGIDGQLARELHFESTFGRMIDPLADKILVGGLVIGLIFKFDNVLFATLATALLLIELSNIAVGQEGGRLAHQLGLPEQAGASRWGKLKFGAECPTVFLAWALLPLSWDATLCSVLLVLILPLALASFAGYVGKIRLGRKLLSARVAVV